MKVLLVALTVFAFGSLAFAADPAPQAASEKPACAQGEKCEMHKEMMKDAPKCDAKDGKCACGKDCKCGKDCPHHKGAKKGHKGHNCEPGKECPHHKEMMKKEEVKKEEKPEAK